MELLEGGVDLGRLVATHGRFSPTEVLGLLEPVCDALHAAHEAGFVHRDLKAGNVMVADGERGRTVKLHDFGIAKLLDPAEDEVGLTASNERLGTPHAMAPEQVRGQQVDRRTDIYAMGVLLYHLLTGRYPFEAARAEDIEWLHVTAAPPPPSESAPVNAEIDAVVLRCLAKLPDERYPDALGLLAAYRAAVDRDERRTRRGRRAGRAIAVLVDVRLSAGALDAGDEVLDGVEDLLATAAARLAGAGFPSPLRMSSSVLAARELQAGADQAVLAEAVAAAHDIQDRLPGNGPDLHVNICLHVDAAVVQETGQTSNVVGGPITQVTAWAPAGQVTGVCATASLIAELPGVAHEPATLGLFHLRRPGA
jgi:serine/threonine-protein kinase